MRSRDRFLRKSTLTIEYAFEQLNICNLGIFNNLLEYEEKNGIIKYGKSHIGAEGSSLELFFTVEAAAVKAETGVQESTITEDDFENARQDNAYYRQA